MAHSKAVGMPIQESVGNSDKFSKFSLTWGSSNYAIRKLVTASLASHVACLPSAGTARFSFACGSRTFDLWKNNEKLMLLRVGVHMFGTKIPFKIYGPESNVQACPFLFDDVFDIGCHHHRGLYFIVLVSNWIKEPCKGKPCS